MALQIGLDQHQRVAHLQHRRGVGDVLRRGAPMAPLAKPALAQRHELLHHRQHRIADALGLGFQFRDVEAVGTAVAHDLGGGRLGNDAKPRLHAGQRRLDVEIELHAALVGEDAPHRLGAEDVAEDSGVEGGCGHLAFCPGLADQPARSGAPVRACKSSSVSPGSISRTTKPAGVTSSTARLV